MHASSLSAAETVFVTKVCSTCWSQFLRGMESGPLPPPPNLPLRSHLNASLLNSPNRYAGACIAGVGLNGEGDRLSGRTMRCTALVAELACQRRRGTAGELGGEGRDASALGGRPT
jgi:hypothetical protein